MERLKIAHIGDGKISNESSSFLLKNILHFPSLNTPLLLIQQFCVDNNCYFEFDSSHVFVKDQVTHEVLL